MILAADPAVASHCRCLWSVFAGVIVVVLAPRQGIKLEHLGVLPNRQPRSKGQRREAQDGKENGTRR